MKAAAGKCEHVDCIALKRNIQRRISAETKGMTPSQRLAYYRKLVDESPCAALPKRRAEKEDR